MSVAARLRHVASLQETVVRSVDAIVDVVHRETGKPHADIVAAEVLHAAAHAQYLVRNAERLLAPRRASPRPLYTKAARVEYHPRGVAAVITPWNYPFLLPFTAMTTALAAGCTVVLKPSERTPASGSLVAQLCTVAGLPAGVVQLVLGGPDAGTAVVQSPVDVVSVVGSADTGRRVAAAAAETLTPVITELGGKHPMIVLEDANLRRAARAAVWGACYGAGQACVAVERVYVVEAVHDRFVQELDTALYDVCAGGEGPRDIGPLISDEHAEHVQQQVDAAVAGGAVLRRGGRRCGPGGRAYEPTLLTGVDHSMAVMREETLGPVLPVMRVADEFMAVNLANDSRYGLHGSVWTRDTARGRRVASRIRAGSVAVNDCLVNYAMTDLPFGGIGNSGSGRQSGPEGLRAYCYTKAVTWTRLALPREVQWFPRVGDVRLWTRALRLLYGRKTRARDTAVAGGSTAEDGGGSAATTGPRTGA
jgi:acyl-CoA reductase-like NAD-dependent aldehyde dehydrogenase